MNSLSPRESRALRPGEGIFGVPGTLDYISGERTLPARQLATLPVREGVATQFWQTT